MELEGVKYYIFQFYQLIVVVAIVCVSFVVYLLRRYSQVEANEPKKAVPESKSKQPESKPGLKQPASKAQVPKPTAKVEASSEEEEEEGEVVTRKRRIISEITVSSSWEVCVLQYLHFWCESHFI